MPNPLFQSPAPQSQLSSALSQVSQIRSMFQSPQAAFQSFYQSNPQFRQFADSMQGKTPEQAFRENGLDFGQFRGMF